jgi:hypothetical protein
MAAGRRPCSDTNWDNQEVKYGTALPVDEDHGNGSLKVTVKGLKKCCISEEKDRWEDEEEGDNVGSECEAEDWNCKDRI